MYVVSLELLRVTIKMLGADIVGEGLGFLFCFASRSRLDGGQKFGVGIS